MSTHNSITHILELQELCSNALSQGTTSNTLSAKHIASQTVALCQELLQYKRGSMTNEEFNQRLSMHSEIAQKFALLKTLSRHCLSNEDFGRKARELLAGNGDA